MERVRDGWNQEGEQRRQSPEEPLSLQTAFSLHATGEHSGPRIPNFPSIPGVPAALLSLLQPESSDTTGCSQGVVIAQAGVSTGDRCSWVLLA